MRSLIPPMRSLIPIAAFILASCGGNQTANDAAVAEESKSSQVSAVNDATAIDAATGEAANMAADVNYTFNEAELNEAAGNEAGNEAGNGAAGNSQ
ncbi:MAG: hypothetical protein ACR2JJ_06975 [Sphingomicrobium sp.]